MTLPSGARAAAIGTAAQAAILLAIAVASLISGHGSFSTAIAIGVLGYAAVLAVASWGMFSQRVWARGPVVATSILNVIVAGSMATAAPMAWLVVALAAATTVIAALPSTTAELHTARDARRAA